MNIERLREVRHLQKEIAELAELRESLYYPISSPKLSNDSHGTTPGDPTARAFRALQSVDEKIASLQMKLAQEVSEILDWLYVDVESSELRNIMICHYLEGMSWYQTTRHVLGYDGTDSARMRVYRYFGKCNDM